jgi:hypothetical protein
MSVRLTGAIAVTACLLLGTAGSQPAAAHHSFAMYDHDRTVTLMGTVTKFQWTNPHAYLEVDVVDKEGAVAHYSIEMTSINMMRRIGWKSSLIKPGDKVEATMAALLDGRPGGLLLDVTLPDGKVWKTGVPAEHTFTRTPDAVVGVQK